MRPIKTGRQGTIQPASRLTDCQPVWRHGIVGELQIRHANLLSGLFIQRQNEARSCRIPRVVKAEKWFELKTGLCRHDPVHDRIIVLTQRAQIASTVRAVIPNWHTFERFRLAECCPISIPLKRSVPVDAHCTRQAGHLNFSIDNCRRSAIAVCRSL